jgi:hypothetical protein
MLADNFKTVFAGKLLAHTNYLTSESSAVPRDFKASTILVGGVLTKLCLWHV